jgi:hypothetical protein
MLSSVTVVGFWTSRSAKIVTGYQNCFQEKFVASSGHWMSLRFAAASCCSCSVDRSWRGGGIAAQRAIPTDDKWVKPDYFKKI